MAAKVVWATPEADALIGWMARVSNPAANKDDPVERLIAYLIKNKHWSPFEMASACVEIETTRDIARQILRHRSFHFQEFSQRYSAVEQEKPITRKARLQDTKNRQNSIATDDYSINDAWYFWQDKVWSVCWGAYQACLKMGIAKEVCRALLPEGLTGTRMFMSGTVRDWLHYIAIRTEKGTQLEHREIATEILGVLEDQLPLVFKAAREAGLIDAKVPGSSPQGATPIDYSGV